VGCNGVFVAKKYNNIAWNTAHLERYNAFASEQIGMMVRKFTSVWRNFLAMNIQARRFVSGGLYEETDVPTDLRKCSVQLVGSIPENRSQLNSGIEIGWALFQAVQENAASYQVIHSSIFQSCDGCFTLTCA
jgi:hypothetical protein